jgi:hypothetical protein
MNPEILSRFPEPIDEKVVRRNIRDLIPYLSLKECPSTKTEGKYLPPFPEKGNLIIKSYLGSGKTTQILDLDEIQDEEKKVIILSCRRTYALATSERFGVKCYLGMKKKDIQTAKRLVLSMESLYKLGDNDTFDLLVGDEIESCLTQFFSSKTMKERVTENMLMFETILRKAKRFILADAFLSPRSIHVIQNMNLKFNLWVHSSPPPDRLVVKLPLKKTFPKALVDKCVDLLLEGKKVFFVSSTKKMCISIEKYILERIPTLRMVSYHSDKENDLANINETWTEFNLILCTSVITVGINYDQENVFDSLFLYLSPWGPSIRDLFQSLHRIRFVTSKTLFYSINFNPKDLWKQIPGFPPLVESPFLREEILDSWDDQVIGQLFKLEFFDKSISSWKKENYIFCKVEQNLGRIVFDYLFCAYLKECGYRNL